MSEIIDYFKEHGIDPRERPFKLKHNDYRGLTYKKGEKEYRSRGLKKDTLIAKMIINISVVMKF